MRSPRPTKTPAAPSGSTVILRKISAKYQGQEVWDEVQACLADTVVQSDTSSLTDALEAAEEKLREHCKRTVLPDGAAGVLVGRGDRIVGMDLFDSPKTLKMLWDRLSDAYLFDALRDPGAVPPTPADQAQKFVERLGSAAKPRIDLCSQEQNRAADPCCTTLLAGIRFVFVLDSLDGGRRDPAIEFDRQ